MLHIVLLILLIAVSMSVFILLWLTVWGYSLLWWRGHGGGSMNLMITLCVQSDTKRDEGWCTIHFLFLAQSSTLVYGMVHSHLGLVFLSQLTDFRNSLTDMPRSWFIRSISTTLSPPLINLSPKHSTLRPYFPPLIFIGSRISYNTKCILLNFKVSHYN